MTTYKNIHNYTYIYTYMYSVHYTHTHTHPHIPKPTPTHLTLINSLHQGKLKYRYASPTLTTIRPISRTPFIPQQSTKT